MGMWMGKKITNNLGGEIEIVDFDKWIDHLATLVRAEDWPEESIARSLYSIYDGKKVDEPMGGERTAIWEVYYDGGMTPEEALQAANEEMED